MGFSECSLFPITEEQGTYLMGVLSMMMRLGKRGAGSVQSHCRLEFHSRHYLMRAVAIGKSLDLSGPASLLITTIPPSQGACADDRRE